MDIHFGRVKEKDGKATIKSINANKQGDVGFNPLFEEEARKLYRNRTILSSLVIPFRTVQNHERCMVLQHGASASK